MLKTLCALLLIAVVASGASIKSRFNLNGRIVGGFPIDIKQVPWQASLQRNGNHSCGASIISNKWLLTAAHCTGLPGMYNLTVRIGSTESANGGSIYQVKRFIKHNKFDPRTVDWDFALLELEECIQFNEAAQPIKMINKQQETADQTIHLVTGWGKTQSAFIDSNEQLLRGAEIPIVNQKKCVDLYKQRRSVTPRMLCAGLEQGGRDACQNDSGGPLVSYDGAKSTSAILVGVVSWGFECGKPNYPGVYSRVSTAREWIFEQTGI